MSNARRGQLRFIITGGTIDSFYDSRIDTVTPNRETIVPQYIEALRLRKKPAFAVVCMKDSRRITRADLRKILAAVEKSPQRRIIITHGTYTMADTARYIKSSLRSPGKTVILTGSLTPLNGFTLSDAGFNLGFAVAKAMELPPGVYICMHGRVFLPEEAAKLVSQARFISIFSDK
ncbi:MAG: asparaginase [Candidatus Diapherotrites archaeon]|uniref:Asparaginase n=1 Tax=Candidatus Iainarchaeum sp. TaxID=3101447 RepID=A0A8T3YNJ8_9ARCH|nr:asparaginase [Candidatus Diapherotrites archaeon]